MERLKNASLIIFGWFFVIVGVIGIFLPLLPTTPFMILALGIFAKSSPKFHDMLINNRWIGDDLKRWKKFKCIKTKTKLRAVSLIIVTFTISILILMSKPYLQVMLVVIAIILIAVLSQVTPCKPKIVIEGTKKNEPKA